MESFYLAAFYDLLDLKLKYDVFHSGMISKRLTHPILQITVMAFRKDKSDVDLEGRPFVLSVV